MVVVGFAAQPNLHKVSDKQLLVPTEKSLKKADRGSMKVTRYIGDNNQTNNNLEGHGGSTIQDWTDSDFTNGLRPEQAAAWGTTVDAGSASSRVMTDITVCVDSYYTEGSFAVWGYQQGGFITNEIFFTAPNECITLNYDLPPGLYDIVSWDSYGDGGQNVFFNGVFIGPSDDAYVSWYVVEVTESTTDPTCADTECGYWIDPSNGYYCEDLVGWGYDCDLCIAEGACPAVPTCEEQGGFECGSGECIPASYFCDGSSEHGNAGWGPDCADGSDEFFDTCCEAGLYDDNLCNPPEYCEDVAACNNGAEGSCEYPPTGLNCDGSIADGYFADCAGNVASDSYLSWVGDGFCDDGDYGLYFRCCEYNFDNGDCGDAIGCDGVASECGGLSNDCAGECGGSAANDDCGVCNGGNADQDCAGDCFGEAVVDECGVCNGDNSSCTDECGVVNGDNTSCADCAGTPNGDSFTDCSGSCLSGGYLSWQGDGYCDDGYWGVDFVCADFNCDNGDCGVDLQADGSCSVSCVDCAGQDCYGYESWIGDGWCDDGAYGFYFDCDFFECDAGDCLNECGVCGDDISSCADCAGVANGDSFEDCAGTCLSAGYLSWIGDGFCDDGSWGADFVTCDGFDFDGGDCNDECGVPLGDNTSCADDCGVPNGDGWSCLVGSGDIDQSGGLDVLDVVGIVGHILGTAYLGDGAAAAADVTADGNINVLDVISIVETILAAEPEGCADGTVDDCSGDGDCCPDSWIGDGYGDCEDQAFGCDLTCYDNDGGDCDVATDDGGTDDSEGCPEGTVEDCSGDGDCCADSWIGDGFGDCEEQAYGCDLTCYGNDGGDCDESEPSEECTDCEYDFTAYGSECCDTAWDQYGIDCATLESNYSWDCSGCACPGDVATEDPCGDCMEFCVEYVVANYGYTVEDATAWCLNTPGSGCADECADDGGSDDGDAGCSEGTVEDCSGDGDCCPASYIGDGFGDCEDQVYGCDLTCYGNDGGDCVDDSEPSEECTDCAYDYSAYGSECCDTAAAEFGLDCATMEGTYGWDCSGCACPLDTDDSGDDSGDDNSGECVNDDSTTDAYGDTCSSWYDTYEGPGSSGCSGAYNDDDFDAAAQCCACQGSRSAETDLNDQRSYELKTAKKYSVKGGYVTAVDNSNARTTKPAPAVKSINSHTMNLEMERMQVKKSTPVIKGREGKVTRPIGELNKSSDSGVTLDKATSVVLMKTDTGLSYKADGFVAFEMTLEHGSDFEIAMTSDGFIAGSNTDGTTTKIVVVNHESNELFTSKGDFEIVDVIAATSGGQVLSVEISTVKEFMLGAAYPNPFNPVTSLSLDVPETGFVSVSVYNMTGQLVSTLADGNMDAGSYSLTWDASDMSSGMYFVKAAMSGSVNVQKVMLLK